MLRLFTKRRVDAPELLASQLFDEQTFYRAFTRDISKAQRNVIIESPFLVERYCLAWGVRAVTVVVNVNDLCTENYLQKSLTKSRQVCRI